MVWQSKGQALLYPSLFLVALLGGGFFSVRFTGLLFASLYSERREILAGQNNTYKPTDPAFVEHCDVRCIWGVGAVFIWAKTWLNLTSINVPCLGLSQVYNCYCHSDTNGKEYDPDTFCSKDCDAAKVRFTRLQDNVIMH